MQIDFNTVKFYLTSSQDKGQLSANDQIKMSHDQFELFTADHPHSESYDTVS